MSVSQAGQQASKAWGGEAYPDIRAQQRAQHGAARHVLAPGVGARDQGTLEAVRVP